MFNDHNIFSNNIYDAANKLRQIQEAQLYSANQMIGIRPIAASRLRRQDTRELSNIIDATRGLSTEDMKRMYNVTPEDIEAFTRVHADIVGEGPGKKLNPVLGSLAQRAADKASYEADIKYAGSFGRTHPEEGNAMAPHLRRTLAWLSTRPHRKDMTPNVFDDLNADGKVSAREVVSAQQENQFTGKIEEQQNKFNKTLLNEAPRRGGRQAIMPGSMPSIMQQLNAPQMPVASVVQQQYVPSQMEPNFVQPGNNPPQPQPFSVVNAGTGIVQGIPGVNVEGPAVPQYVPRQMEPNYVQPGNNPAQPQPFSVVTAGRGATPNKFSQFAGGIMKAIDDVRRGMPAPQQSFDATKTGTGVGQFQQVNYPWLNRLFGKKTEQEETQKSNPLTQTTIPAGDPNNPATYMPGNVQVSNRPSPAEFNQAAMKPGGVYQIDQSGYAQSYLPAQQQNVAPTRIKQQPVQQQQPAQQQQQPQQSQQQTSQQSTRDAMAQYGAQQFAQNATNLAFGGIFNNPQQQQQQVQQKPVQQQQQQPSPSTPFFQRAGETPEEIQQYQQQNQTWGAFGMRGQSPQEMEAYNRQVNSRRK